MPPVCDPTYCALCAGAILDRICAVRRLAGPVRKAKDAEAVHDMRVASRRLRAALAVFQPCLPAQAASWRKDIRRITRALGRARDLDVQIDFVRSFRAGCRRPACRPGLDRLLRKLRGRRSAAQEKVVKSLSRLASRGTLKDMQGGLERLARSTGRDASVSAEAYRLSGGIIGRLLNDLMSYQRDLDRPEAVERHHQMRIAAKRLRYSLEVFRPVYGSAIDRSLQAAKQMQTLLGGLHDCDEWIAVLPDFLAAERIRAVEHSKDPDAVERLTDGIETLRRDRVRRRRALHGQCRRYWGRCKNERVWLRLQDILLRAPANAEGRPPAATLAPRSAKGKVTSAIRCRQRNCREMANRAHP